METKKHQKSDIDRYRTIFTQVGIILSLVLMIVVFEWSVETTPEILESGTYVEIDIEINILPVIRNEEIKPPTPKPKITSALKIVNNNVEKDKENDARLTKIEKFSMKNIELEEEETEDPGFIYPLETAPEFPGGENGLKKFIFRNLEYPVIALENDIQGKVYVRFLITDEGKVEQVTVLREIHPLLDKEAVRIIESLPYWKPATLHGKPTNYWKTIPISFVIR